MVKLNSLCIVGVEGKLIEIEVSLLPGLHKFVISGLADRSITEAKDRIMSALLNQKFEFPYGHLTINLAPAELEKHGVHLDLPMAIGALSVGSGYAKLRSVLNDFCFLGELGLFGEVKSLKDVIALVLEAKGLGYKTIVVPKADIARLQGIKNINLIGVESLRDTVQVVSDKDYAQYKLEESKEILPQQQIRNDEWSADLLMLADRDLELRLLQIAAAGKHALLLDGPPGGGKTTMLRSLGQLLPDLTEEQSLEVAKIYSLVGQSRSIKDFAPPVRLPHHSISDVAMLGGGSNPTPGEITLAHLGLLALDEVSEFSLSTLEGLRQPLTTDCIEIARARYRVKFPAQFQLVATRNPCPCGWLGSDMNVCSCQTVQLQSYRRKLSGPFLDRIDMKYRVNQPKTPLVSKGMKAKVDTIASAKNKVVLVSERVKDRAKNGTDLKLDLNMGALNLLENTYREGKLTLRSVKKIISIASTVRFFADSVKINEDHIYEAIQLNSNLNKL